jgi:hypothetical protein
MQDGVCVQQSGRVRGIAEIAVVGSTGAFNLVCFLSYLMFPFACYMQQPHSAAA